MLVFLLSHFMPEDKETAKHESLEEQADLKKIIIATAVGVVILVAITYASYRYSQRKSETILPGGTTYLGPTPQGEQPPTAPQVFTVDVNTPWKIHNGSIYPFSLSYPQTLTLVVYTNDPTDTVSVGWGNIPPQQNVLLDVERVAEIAPKYENLPKEEFVRNWWQKYSGLKGLKSIERFTNANGLVGFRAWYFDFNDKTPVENIFFEAPGNKQILIHLANGTLDKPVFDRIVQSLSWKTPSPAIQQP